MSDLPQRLSSGGRDVAAWAAAYAFPLLAGAALGVSLVHLVVRPLWCDQTYLLHLAGRVLDGARVGFDDITEPNPPLIIWLSMLPVAIARGLGIGATGAFQGCIAVLAAVSIGWSTVLLRRSPDDDSKRFAAWFVLVMLLATVIHPWRHSGQREHLMLLLVLPYLVMVAARLDGQVPSAGEAVAAGLCAAVGFLLKPHHLLVAIAIEGLLLVRRGPVRSLLRPEAVTMMATGLAYAAAIWLLARDYVLTVVPLALDTYNDYHHAELSDLFSPGRVLKIAVIVLLWAVLYRRLVHRALATVLLLAGVGATIAYAVQLKGHEYQFVPAIGFFGLLLGAMAIDLALQTMAPRSPPIPLRRATVGALLAAVAAVAFFYPRQVEQVAGTTNERTEVLRWASQFIPDNATMVVLSTSPETVFEHVLERNWRWGSRFMCLWMVPALVNTEQAADRAGTIMPAAAREAATLTRQAVLSDIARWQPSPVLVDRCQDTDIAPCMGMGTLRVDLLQWLKQDPGFAGGWTDYMKAGQVGPYDLWCRKGETAVCSRILAGTAE
jgi:hypothetical protein